jgi:hypothetical protein
MRYAGRRRRHLPTWASTALVVAGVLGLNVAVYALGLYPIVYCH